MPFSQKLLKSPVTISLVNREARQRVAVVTVVGHNPSCWRVAIGGSWFSNQG